MIAESSSLLALAAGLAAPIVAGCALLVRSQVHGEPERASRMAQDLSPALARQLGRCLYGIAALTVVLAVMLKFSGRAPTLLVYSITTVCEGVLALSVGVIAALLWPIRKQPRRSDDRG